MVVRKEERGGKVTSQRCQMQTDPVNAGLSNWQSADEEAARNVPSKLT